MQRDRLLLTEIIDAAERIIDLAAARSADDFVADRDRRDALLCNRIVHGYWSVDVDVLVTTARIDLPAFLISVRTIETSMAPTETDSD